MALAEESIRSIEEIAAGEIAVAAAEVDAHSEFPARSLGALGDIGALGLTVPTEHGGQGGSLAELAEACETIGGACASTGMVFLMHAVTAATIAAGGGARADEYLRGLADGTLLGTLAFSERGTGAHFYAPELSATAEGGELRISGRKSFVTSGGHADLYLVLVNSSGSEGLDCYAVGREADGVEFEGRWEGLGLRGNSSVAMTLDAVTVDDDARIGAAGAGGELVFSVVAPVFLVGLAGVNVGIAAAALNVARAHASARRYADGSLLAEVPAIQAELADIAIAVRAAGAALREAASLGDQDDAEALIAIMSAKIAATEAAEAATSRALEVCGGQGYTPALPVERLLRDARAGRVMAPTNAVLRTWIGKALAGLPVP
jgi:alkylation response protein AidB-like acyl-CoA dehydrogenase